MHTARRFGQLAPFEGLDQQGGLQPDGDLHHIYRDLSYDIRQKVVRAQTGLERVAAREQRQSKAPAQPESAVAREQYDLFATA